MPKQSAGILLYRIRNKIPEFFLVHPGGPFWARKDLKAWSVPKGETEEDENPVEAAKREFEEETGIKPSGIFEELPAVIQKGGKKVICFAAEGEIDADNIKSNTFEMDWPPGSGRRQAFPEVDRAGWFDAATAKQKINESQSALIDVLIGRLKSAGKI